MLQDALVGWSLIGNEECVHSMLGWRYQRGCFIYLCGINVFDLRNQLMTNK